jgi:hypothetical protein
MAFRKKKSQQDDNVALKARELADGFVIGAARDGYQFDYTPASAERLNTYADDFVASGPPDEVKHSVIIAMGTFLGELIVRNGAGRWQRTESNELTVVLERAGQDAFTAYPLNKVAKRIGGDKQQDIKYFYDVCVRGGPIPDNL